MGFDKRPNAYNMNSSPFNSHCGEYRNNLKYWDR